MKRKEMLKLKGLSEKERYILYSDDAEFGHIALGFIAGLGAGFGTAGAIGMASIPGILGVAVGAAFTGAYVANLFRRSISDSRCEAVKQAQQELETFQKTGLCRTAGQIFKDVRKEHGVIALAKKDIVEASKAVAEFVRETVWPSVCDSTKKRIENFKRRNEVVTQDNYKDLRL